ncbi:hypothetical protein BH09VER1_BH09VER1_56450 [soil metagenome]
MQEIFVIRAGQEEGPLTLKEVRRRVALGELSREDMAWTTGMARKVPLAILLRTGTEAEEVKVEETKIQAELAPKSLWAMTPGWVILLIAVMALGALGTIGGTILSFARQLDYSPVAPMQKSSLGGLELEAPLVFKKLEIHPPPEALTKKVESYQAMGGNLNVFTAVAEFPSGAEIDLEAGTDKIMRSVAEMVEAPLPDYSKEPIEISGFPANKVKVVFKRRNTVSGEIEDYPLSLLFIKSGNRAASVAIVEMKVRPEVSELAQKILASVTMTKPEDEK